MISSLDHILLYLFLYFLCVKYEESRRMLRCYNNVTNKNNLLYFRLALCFTYILVEGLRYGRGVDQVGNYGPFYIEWCFKPQEYFQEFEKLFVWLNQTVYQIDVLRGLLPFGSIFMVYAAIFIVCFLKFHENYISFAKYFVLLGLLATLHLTEWTIRQGVGYSFLLCGLYYLERGRYKVSLFFTLICCCIHNGNIVLALMVILGYLCFNKKPLPYYLSIPTLILLEIIVETTNISEILVGISNFADVATSNTRYYDYLDADFIEREQAGAEEMQRGFVTQSATILFYSTLIYLGNKIHLIKPKGVYLYNVFVVSLILYDPFRMSGSFFRLFLPGSTLWFVSLSIVFENVKLLRKEINYIVPLIMIIIFYIILYWGRFVFFNPKAEYIWS